MKSYEKLKRELIEDEEAEEEPVCQLAMVKGECRWRLQELAARCDVCMNGVCGRWISMFVSWKKDC